VELTGISERFYLKFFDSRNFGSLQLIPECAENLRSPLLTLAIGLKRVARELGITILE